MISFNEAQLTGMLLGLHAGDSLGATIEFLPPSPAWNSHTEIIGGGEFHWKAGEATDDTDLALCVLKSIDSKDKFNFNTLKSEMLAWFHSKPPDVGNTTKKGLANLDAGKPLRECGFVDETFQGNGSIMRVAPMVLLSEDAQGFYGDQVVSSLREIMITQTKMTHGHQNCVDSDVVFISALKSIFAGESKEQTFAKALQTAREVSPLIAERIQVLPQITWAELKTSGFCVDTLCAGLWGFMNYNSLEEAVIAVVNRGDDADSCGSVTGALCGAYYGVQAIPERWLNLLEMRSALMVEVNRLRKTL